MSAKIKSGIMGLIAFTSLVLGNCAGSRCETVSKVENFWGPPVRVERMPDGSEKRFYPFKAEGQWEYVYFVFRDGVVAGQGGSIAPR